MAVNQKAVKVLNKSIKSNKIISFLGGDAE